MAERSILTTECSYMNIKVLKSLVLGVLLGSIFTWWLQFTTEPEPAETPMNDQGLTVRQMNGQMMNEAGQHMAMMQHMFVTSERSFIEMMIPHHEEAIVTAEAVLERGGTTEDVRDLMNDIITAQTAEVAAMREWYTAWFGEPYADKHIYEPMMRDLSGLSGAALDQAFLEDMIPHHMGAIMMARSVQPHIEHEEMRELTQNVVRTQSAEIVQMRRILENL